MPLAHSIQSLGRIDPTRTLTLRNTFSADMKRRFTAVVRAIRRAVIDQDIFGLLPENVVSIRAFAVLDPGRRAFAFRSSGEKIAGFMSWLDDMVRDEILEVYYQPRVGSSIQSAWSNIYIDSAYQQGIRKARSQMAQAGIDVPSLDAIGGMGAVFNSPFHADRVGILYTRAFGDLKGITDAMEGQVSRILSQAMAEGKHPREMAKLLTRTITGPVGDLGITDTLGRFIPAQRRASMLARTEVIRAHAEAQLQEYENFGQFDVFADVEFRTSGNACPICESLEGHVYTTKQARGVIPVHPQCRCAWLPKLRDEGEEISTIETEGYTPSPRRGVIPPIPEETPRERARREGRARERARIAREDEARQIAMRRPEFTYATVNTIEEAQARFKAVGVKKITNHPMSLESQIEMVPNHYTDEQFLNVASGALREVERLNTQWPNTTARMFKKPLASIDMVNDPYPIFKKNNATIGGFFDPNRNRVMLGMSGDVGYINPSIEDINLFKRKHVAVSGRNGYLRHELGHKLYAQLYSEWMENSTISKWKSIWKNRYYDPRRKIAEPIREISNYALTNENEAFAEAFSVITHPEYKFGTSTSLAPEIEQFFLDLEREAI